MFQRTENNSVYEQPILLRSTLELLSEIYVSHTQNSIDFGYSRGKCVHFEEIKSSN